MTVSDNAAIFQHGDCLLNHFQGHQEPFPWPERLAEAVFEFDAQPGIAEKAVNEIFQFEGVDS